MDDLRRVRLKLTNDVRCILISKVLGNFRMKRKENEKTKERIVEIIITGGTMVTWS